MTAPIRLQGPIEWTDAELLGQERVDGRGRRSLDTRVAILVRDATIAEAALRFYPLMSSVAAARVLHAGLSRYQSGAWRRHRTEENMPARLAGRVEGMYWFVLKMRDALPSERTIRAAIDASKKTHRWRR